MSCMWFGEIGSRCSFTVLPGSCLAMFCIPFWGSQLQCNNRRSDNPQLSTEVSNTGREYECDTIDRFPPLLSLSLLLPPLSALLQA